jgi:hypothetical protein
LKRGVSPIGDATTRVAPGQTVAVRVSVAAAAAGRYIVELDCVAAHTYRGFAPLGSAPARVTNHLYVLL